VREHGEMRTSRQAEQGESPGIDAELVGMGAHPAQTVPDVGELRREAVRRREPIRDRHGGDAAPGEVEGVSRRLAGIAPHPAAPVHEHHGRGGLGGAQRAVVVEAKGLPARLGEDDVGAQLMDW
jgi:hypothetical protein